MEELKPERPEIPVMTGEDDILEKLQLEKERIFEEAAGFLKGGDFVGLNKHCFDICVIHSFHS